MKPDMLNLTASQRENLKKRGEIGTKEDAGASPVRFSSPMHCSECGSKLLLVHIKPEPTSDNPKRWNGRFWCLNAACGSFCEDVTLLVE